MTVTQSVSSRGFPQVLFTLDPVGQRLEVIDSYFHAGRMIASELEFGGVSTLISRERLEHPVTVVGVLQLIVTPSATLRRFL